MKQLIDKAALMAEIRKMRSTTIDEYGNFYTAKARAEYNTLCYLENHIDTLEVKEMRDIWHDVTEKPELGQPLLIVMNGTYKDFRRRYRIGCYDKKANDIPTWVIDGCYSDSFISKWCYISDILQHTLEVKEVDSTDAFVEKATSYIQQHWIWNTKMIEDFKNYMIGG